MQSRFENSHAIAIRGLPLSSCTMEHLNRSFFFFFKPICHFLFHCYLSLWCQKVFLALIKHPFIPFKQIFPGSELSIVARGQLGFVSYRRAKQFPWHKGQVQWVSSIKSWKQIQLHSKYTMMCVFCFLRSAPEFLSVFFLAFLLCKTLHSGEMQTRWQRKGWGITCNKGHRRIWTHGLPFCPLSNLSLLLNINCSGI